MGWLSRAAAAAGRGAARLVPAERRDWAEALWAEAYQVPPGAHRLAWRAGGVWLVAREALMTRRAAGALVFAVAAAWLVWAAWPGPAGSAATAVDRVDVVTVVLLLAGLPLLVRRLAGPAADGWMARVLRFGGFAAVLVLTVAKASVERVADAPAVAHLVTIAVTPGQVGMLFIWIFESLFLLVMAVYLAAILGLTARRSRVAPGTLAIGTSAGIVVGVVLYALVPLGLATHATSPWLGGAATGAVEALAWTALVAAPVVAGAWAGRRYLGPGSPDQVADARTRQSAAAGFLATGVGALIVNVLGTGTIALMSRASWLLHWLYPGQHLLAAVVRARELTASADAAGYLLILLAFPVIGLVLGLTTCAPIPEPGRSPDGGGPPGPPGLEPAPGPVAGGRLAGPEADAGGRAGSLPGCREEGPDGADDEAAASAAADACLPAGWGG